MISNFFFFISFHSDLFVQSNQFLRSQIILQINNKLSRAYKQIITNPQQNKSEYYTI
jgi:hypothetical protein